MAKPKSAYGKYGFEEGYQASFDTDWQPGEMEEKSDADELGEIAGQILENWQQMADTIYYQDVSEANLERFENGFYEGFRAGVKKQLSNKEG